MRLAPFVKVRAARANNLRFNRKAYDFSVFIYHYYKNFIGNFW